MASRAIIRIVAVTTVGVFLALIKSESKLINVLLVRPAGAISRFEMDKHSRKGRKVALAATSTALFIPWNMSLAMLHVIDYQPE